MSAQDPGLHPTASERKLKTSQISLLAAVLTLAGSLLNHYPRFFHASDSFRASLWPFSVATGILWLYVTWRLFSDLRNGYSVEPDLSSDPMKPGPVIQTLFGPQ
jgi:hypothetical protein